MSSSVSPRLSLRLQAIADLVTEGNRLADIGTDHAWLPIRLCLDGKIPSAVAMDIRKGPASAAAEHICQAGLEDRIEVRISDGLAGLEEGETDTIVIAGMGGALIRRILAEAEEKIHSFSELVLGPQSEPELVRRFLESIGFSIVQEKLICEDGKYYPIIKAVHADACRSMKAEELAYGPCLLHDRNSALKEWLIRKKETNQQLQRSLKPLLGEAASTRIDELKEEAQLLEAALKYYEM